MMHLRQWPFSVSTWSGVKHVVVLLLQVSQDLGRLVKFGAKMFAICNEALIPENNETCWSTTCMIVLKLKIWVCTYRESLVLWRTGEQMTSFACCKQNSKLTWYVSYAEFMIKRGVSTYGRLYWGWKHCNYMYSGKVKQSEVACCM